MQYPKVYYQMKAMLRACERTAALVKDQDRLAFLTTELKDRIELIECEHMDNSNEFTGGLDDRENEDVYEEEHDFSELKDIT